MKPHEFQFGDQPWPEGEGTVQVYAPVDLSINPEVAELVEKARIALEGAPVTFVKDDELHITIDTLAGVRTDQISQAERERLEATLRAELADTPVYHGTAGSSVIYVTGPIVDVSPAAPLIKVQKKVRSAIFGLYGAPVCTFVQSKPHITIAYCHTPCESDPWARKVRKIDPAHAPLVITSVELVDVRPDNVTKELHWSAVAPPIRFVAATTDDQ
jgi:2'-5' RNA ligase